MSTATATPLAVARHAERRLRRHCTVTVRGGLHDGIIGQVVRLNGSDVQVMPITGKRPVRFTVKAHECEVSS